MRSALRQNLPAPAGTFSCSRARCNTCSFLNSATSISGPKSNFVILHNFACTSSNIIYFISCVKLYIGETGRRQSDRFAEHLRSVRNNDVDKPVARHFNIVNHSISDIKVCAISPISCGNDSRKRHEKRLIFKIGTIHSHGLNERFSFIWSIHIVSVFVQHVRTKALTSRLLTSLFMFIHLPLIHFAPPPRLLIDFKNRFAIFYRIPCYLLFKNRLTYFCILLRIIMHLLLFLSSDLLYIYLFGFLSIFLVSLWRIEGPTLETLVFILSVSAVHRLFIFKYVFFL